MINLNNRHGPVRLHCRDGDPYKPRDGTLNGCCTIRARDSIWINPRERIGINPRDGSNSRPRDGTFGPPGLCRKRRKTPGKGRLYEPERERYALPRLKNWKLFIKLN